MSVRRRFRSLSSLIAAFGLALGAVVLAPAGESRAEPIVEIAGEKLEVRADRLDVDLERNTATLDGHVKLALGELEVNAAKVELAYDQAPRVKWAKGSGGVRARVKGVDAMAASVEVDVVARVVRLSGGVRLSRGKGWVKADRASIDIATKKVTLESVSGSIPVETARR
jgi:lipopolysaccharide export system protein LptA